MLLRRTAIVALLPLGLAACDSAALSRLPGFRGPEAVTAPVATAPASGQPPAVSPLDVPIEVAGAQTTLGTANAAFTGVNAFTAQGNGWLAAIRGSNAAVRRPGAKDAQANVRRVDFGQGAEFVGAVGERTFSVNLRATACQDAAGATWPMSATMRLAGTTVTGCAAPTGQEPRSFTAELPTIRPVAPAKPATTRAPAVKKAAPKPAAPAEAAPTPATPAATTPEAATPTPATTTPTTTAPATPAPAETTTAPATTPAPATEAPDAPATPAPAEAAPAPATTTPPATGTTTPVVIPPVN